MWMNADTASLALSPASVRIYPLGGVARDFVRSLTFVRIANLGELIQMRRSQQIILGADLRFDDLSSDVTETTQLKALGNK